MRREVMSISEFKSRNFKGEKEIKRKKAVKTAAKVGVATTIILIGIPDVSFASSGIDKAAGLVYSKLLLVGKWIIIVKGAIDTINNVVQGDLGGAKKSFMGYLVVYLILNGLPWAMDQVDTVFKEI